MAKQWLRDFFTYTWKEATGVLLLVVFALLIRTGPALFPQDSILQFTELEKFAIDSFSGSYKNSSKNRTTLRMFVFDPNTVAIDSLKLLGLKSWLAQRVVKYRSTGYSFRKPDDLLKIYGMDTAWYLRVKPWIRIRGSTDSYRMDRDNQKRDTTHSNPKTWSHTHWIVDIAVADSAGLQKIRGVGPVLASRIVKYRELLGGFHRLSQLMEVYGIDEAKYGEISAVITLSAAPLVKLDLNQSDPYSLSRHPYLNLKQAKAIVAYRNAHPGEAINSVTIRKIIALDAATIEKITPYLPVDQGL